MSDVKLLCGIIETIADICKDNLVNKQLEQYNVFKNLSPYQRRGFKNSVYHRDLITRKELSHEIFNVINKGLNDSKN